ncbi:dicarboxylate/amino acid:cation symporter [Sphingomonas sp. HITSZ_GF]|uniref:dicarboxylate/amino acid:cation symporter n=1 Tax=Sphingomonas sp. HITSZ_GF TaxID=3037247 RepID=UPI00240D889C|nr:dicarboxylate/amino acid:cation symporter [Sphingomonas sp. HITSZ_GF]MDG2532992.1 dicarboxylate/amino acid:cation symporter [Sphingomonas sp. HITSZ_GF]
MGKRLTWFILAALLLGGLLGYALNLSYAGTPEGAATLDGWAYYLDIPTQMFLHLIKMIIAPLVVSTLVVGIAHMGGGGAIGRVGLKAFLWFVCASLVSLTLGLVLVNALQPGVGLNLPLPAVTEKVDVTTFDVAKFFIHIIPTSGIDAMASNDILQLVIFSLFFGVGLAAVGEKGAPLVRGLEALVQVMLTVTGYVMLFAPVAVFCAVAKVLATKGIGVVGDLAFFMGSFYLGLAVLWAVLLGACFLIVGPRTGTLIRYLRDPILLGFSTASSEAAYPRTLDALDRFGVPPRIASFVLPLGYSFNLDGSMMYMTFASIFIAQAYGIHLDWMTMIQMLLILMVTSKGIAGVPRASLVVITGTLSHFNIPEAGVLLILAVDHFLDMGRTATNVIGNAVASTVVARWEGKLDAPQPVEPVVAAPTGPVTDADSFEDYGNKS